MGMIGSQIKSSVPVSNRVLKSESFALIVRFCVSMEMKNISINAGYASYLRASMFVL